MSGLFPCCVNPGSPCPEPGWVSVAGIVTSPPASPVPYQLFLVDVGGTGAFEGHDEEYTYFSSATQTWEFCTPTQGDKVTIVGLSGSCTIWCYNGTQWESITTPPGTTYTAASLAPGGGSYAVYAGTVGNEFQFYPLVAGANVSLALVGNRIRITSTASGGGEVNVGANLGASAAQVAEVYSNKTLATLNFRRIKSNSAQLQLTQDANYVLFQLTKTIPDPATVENIGTGAGIWKDLTPGFANRLRTILGGNGVTVTQGADEVTIGMDWAATLENVGTGAEVYKAGSQVQFRTIKAGDSTVAVVQLADEIHIGTLYGALNVGASGLGVFKQINGTDFEFYKLVAGANMAITQVADTLVFASTGVGPGAPGTVASSEKTSGTTTVPAAGTWVAVPFNSPILSHANVTVGGGDTEFTLNATATYIVSAKVTLETGSARTQHAVRISIHNGVSWSVVNGSLAYAYTPNDYNDYQTLHTGSVTIAALIGNKLKVEVMATSGTLDATVLNEATAISIYSA